MENKLDLILNELQTVNQHIGKIELRLGGVEQRIDRMEQRISKIEEGQELIKFQLDENTQMIRVIYDRQEETDAKLEALSMESHQTQGQIISHKEILEKLSMNQLRQESVLERLSIRSFEQESDIATLRQIS